MNIKEVNLNLAEIEIIKHTLGYDYCNYSFRNHFVTKPSSSDGVICEGLVQKGLMTRHSEKFLLDECCAYNCTDDCKLLIMRICGYTK